MNKRLFILITSFIVCFKMHAQDVSYPVHEIPATLLKDANAVMRVDETKVTINDISSATVYHKYVVTILNEAGDGEADFDEVYDKFTKVEGIEGKLFDADGKKIRSMKKDELIDVSNVGNDLINDYRVKHHSFADKNYPYTVEYEYSIKMNGIFYFDSWEPVKDKNFAVENSQLTVMCPANYALRYKSFNYDKKPSADSNTTSKTYQWSVANIPAINYQQFQPEWHELTPTIYFAPADFEIQGYKGNMSTWQNFGKFIYSLNQGRDQLPDNVKQTVHLLTDNLIDAREKIKILYQFLQKNTRYVGIQLGIGGWQTFDARYVSTKGYGDCKALSNFMVSLLKEAGIKSYYTLVKAGSNNAGLLSDFPSNQFNHIIVCVPLQKDTMWLECTSNTLPAGYLGDFTCGRNALLIDEDGGVLVYTHCYKSNDNLQLRNINSSIDSNGLLHATIKTVYSCLQQDYLHEMINGLSKEKVLEYLKQQSLGVASFDITSYSYKEYPDVLPSIEENLEMVSDNYATVSGKRLFIIPNILNRSDLHLQDYEERTCDIVLNNDFKDIDSVEIAIPQGYIAESVPADIKLETKFGKYFSSVKILPGKIIYYRVHEAYSGHFPVSDAKALADYFEKIYKADRSKVVLRKSQ